ncbi:hypothetical protein DCAR_0313806 [Daucus carota subsp. sativus]|uniref:Poly [ADP-ribose] polymerase n=1 Tax=Daucus carota subsp. sativus TaxID=79200 RepID=A0AAF0WUR5_DAUCS|nr:hypothetical protein DCAR_0313806 [Daucus carota subsp. sativus]
MCDYVKVHETRSSAAGSEDQKMTRRKHKTDNTSHDTGDKHAAKKVKSDNGNENGSERDVDRESISAEFEKFCKEISNHLSVEQMRKILEANGRGCGSDDAVVPICMDMVYYGPLDQCPICGGGLEWGRTKYFCTGAYSEWSTCTFNTREPPRKEEELVIPDSIKDTPAYDLLKDHQDPKSRNKMVAFGPPDKPFTGMTISLSGRLSQTQQRWKRDIEEHGGKVANSVLGVTCLIVSPSDRERGGSSKVTEAVENGIPVVTEAWLLDCIKKQEALPLDAYDVVSDLAVEGKGIPWSKQDPDNEALESIAAELKIYGKRGVYKDSKLEEIGGKIFEKDGILFNCLFSLSDKGRELNEFSVMQLIEVPNKNLHLYYKKGNVGNDPRAEEQLVEWENVDDAITDFKRLFEELTGNEFEPWEREKKFKKKLRKFFPVDMADGYDVRYGGLGLRQLGVAAAHCKLDPMVASFMKVLCSQEIYRYALMELGMDSPDLPIGMLSEVHLQICEETLLELVEKIKGMKEEGQKAMAVWSDFSQRWFTLLHSTRPFIFKSFNDMADHAASAFETVRDIVTASHLVGNMRGSTLDDPLTECYKRLGCAISPVENDSDDYKMIINYLEKTYEPVKVGEISYSASVENIYAVELSACPSFEEIKKLPNKVLLWCGTRSSNLMRHLNKGFLPAVCQLPVPGYMFGKAIVCSDAAAEAARYGFTAVDRPEGFLVLAVASLGEKVVEVTSPPKETKSYEDKKLGVLGLGRKKTDEAEHIMWKDDIKVPCGRLVPSEHKDSVLDYNEYAVYDPQQVSIRFLVKVKFEEQDVEYEEASPE